MRGLLISYKLFLITTLIGACAVQPSLEILRDTSDLVVIRNAQYLNTHLGEIISGKDILIEDGVILRISNDIVVPDNSAKEIDGTERWLIPGLIDAHMHLFQSGGLYTRPDALDLRDLMPYERERTWLNDHADDILRSYLRVGITTVIDVGGPLTNYSIREKYHGRTDLTEYYCTGPLISTYQPEAFNISDPPIIKVRTTQEARDQVLKQLPHKPDFIKIWYITGGVMTADSNYDIVKATIEESHKHDLKVAVHATQLNTAKLAVKAGADILVHSVSSPIDREFIKMLIDNNVVLIPTLVVHAGYDLAFSNQVDIDDHDLSNSIPYPIGTLLDVVHIDHPQLKEAKSYAGEMLERNRKSDVIRKDNLKRLVDAGVIIATGTDAGNIGTLHATSYMDELRAMSEAGLSNVDILKASTIGAAQVLDQAEKVGNIAVGMQADMVLLRSNPMEDIEAILDIDQVIRKGVSYDPGDLALDGPEELVQRQLNAYNLQDLDAFLEPYSDSVAVYKMPNVLLYVGKKKMRETYDKLFKSTPDLHCELINRTVQEATIIDHEHITGLDNNEEIDARVIYKIRNNKIQEVYFEIRD